MRIFSLNRTPRGGTLTSPIRPPKRKTIICTIAGLLIIVCIGSALHFKNKKNNQTPLYDDSPYLEETFDDETIDDGKPAVNNFIFYKNLENIEENWHTIGSSYSDEDIEELMKYFSNLESVVEFDTAEEMMRDTMDKAITSALNNSIMGTDKYPIYPINISGFIENDSSYPYIEGLEASLNDALTNKDSRESILKTSLQEEITIVLNGETVDGFTLENASPNAKLVYTVLLKGINDLSSTLGNDVIFEVNGEQYDLRDLRNSTLVDDIVEQIKKDLGIKVKVIRR